MIRQLTRLGRKSRTNKRPPIMAHNNTPPSIAQKPPPHADHKLRHGLEQLARSIHGQPITAPIARQINRHKRMSLLQRRRPQNMPPQQIRVGKPVHKDR